MSIRCNEIVSHYNEQAQVRICALAGWDREHSLQPAGFDWWLYDMEVCRCIELGCRYSKHENRCSETFAHRSEWSLPFDNVMYDANVELLCWYVNVCLVMIDSYNDGMYIVHVGILAQAYT